MSAAKMVADSTQGDFDEPKKKRKRKKENGKKKSKKLKKRDRRKDKGGKKEDDDSDLDLEKDLHPIGDYIRQRHEMNEQLFHCLRGPTLQRYIPDVLKELSLNDLKKRCLEHLEIMSKKRIRRILSGDDPSTISSSGTEDSSSEEQEASQEPEVEKVVDNTQEVSSNGEGSCSEIEENPERHDLEEGETISDKEASVVSGGEITSDESDGELKDESELGEEEVSNTDDESNTRQSDIDEDSEESKPNMQEDETSMENDHFTNTSNMQKMDVNCSSINKKLDGSHSNNENNHDKRISSSSSEEETDGNEKEDNIDEIKDEKTIENKDYLTKSFINSQNLIDDNNISQNDKLSAKNLSSSNNIDLVREDNLYKEQNEFTKNEVDVLVISESMEIDNDQQETVENKDKIEIDNSTDSQTNKKGPERSRKNSEMMEMFKSQKEISETKTEISESKTEKEGDIDVDDEEKFQKNKANHKNRHEVDDVESNNKTKLNQESIEMIEDDEDILQLKEEAMKSMKLAVRKVELSDNSEFNTTRETFQTDKRSVLLVDKTGTTADSVTEMTKCLTKRTVISKENTQEHVSSASTVFETKAVISKNKNISSSQSTVTVGKPSTNISIASETSSTLIYSKATTAAPRKKQPQMLSSSELLPSSKAQMSSKSVLKIQPSSTTKSKMGEQPSTSKCVTISPTTQKPSTTNISVKDSSSTGGLTGVLTKNQMELLELEMRARAIKAMLSAHEKKEKSQKMTGK